MLQRLGSQCPIFIGRQPLANRSCSSDLFIDVRRRVPENSADLHMFVRVVTVLLRVDNIVDTTQG